MSIDDLVILVAVFGLLIASIVIFFLLVWEAFPGL